MSPSALDVRSNARIMVYTASAMYVAALLDGALEGFLPGDPNFSMLPVFGVLGSLIVLLTVGARLPRPALSLFGPFGVALIAFALATTPGAGDGAVLYALPVLWTTFFFGRRGALAIIACVGVAHAFVLLSLPSAYAYPGRWVDVMVSACAIAVVVLILEDRNRACRDEARDQAQEASIARDEAVEASNMKSAFLANVSHEVRTPMNGVIGMTELLLSTELNVEQREYAEQVSRSGEQMLSILNDILDLSKIEGGHLELDLGDFDLHRVIEQTCSSAASAAHAKGVQLTVDIAAEVPRRRRGDERRIGQILLNLVSNAIKFTASGGVFVRVGARDATNRATCVRVEVTDTGIGIEPRKLAQMFEPFTQADVSTTRTYGGTGLGLAISAELVHLMGGEISARSVPGHGSTFWFELELAAPRHVHHEREGEEPSAPPEPRSGAPRVLIAEDSPVNQVVAARMLERCGCHVTVVGDGREAVDEVRRDTYDLVLMDCQMPNLDGYAATAEVRRLEGAGRHTPIVGMTAHALEGDRERCLDSGMDGYISKPMHFADLAAKLEEWLAGAGEADERGDAELARAASRRDAA